MGGRVEAFRPASTTLVILLEASAAATTCRPVSPVAPRTRMTLLAVLAMLPGRFEGCGRE